MKLFKDFKTFAAKGNVVDMAVGVILGGAFGKIVSSLVNDIIMPAVSLLIGKVDFSKLKIVINEAITDAATGEIIKPELALTYGVFLQNVVDFLIIAFSIFLFIRILTAPKREREEEEKKEKEAKAAIEKKKAEEEAKLKAEAEAIEKAKPTRTELLLMEIRDSLKKQG